MKDTLKDLSFLELFILNTISFFDGFNYPVTLYELQDFIFTGGMDGQSYSLSEIKETLSKSQKLKKIIASSQGFYYLQGREELIDTRLNRYNISNQKFKIVLKAVKWFRLLPNIRLVAVCNNLAYWNADTESDLDLFIITAPKRIWQTRLFLIILISLLGLRPPKEKAKDKLCLSFYTTEDNLDLSKIKISVEDIYLVFWLATLWPIYDRGNYYKQLIEANTWFKKYLPNWQLRQPNSRHQITDTKFSRRIFKIKEFFSQGIIGDWLETLAKNLQLKKMSQKKKDIAVGKRNWVILSDQMLKFHDNDRRWQIMEEFEQKRKKLLEKI